MIWGRISVALCYAAAAVCMTAMYNLFRVRTDKYGKAYYHDPNLWGIIIPTALPAAMGILCVLIGVFIQIFNGSGTSQSFRYAAYIGPQIAWAIALVWVLLSSPSVRSRLNRLFRR